MIGVDENDNKSEPGDATHDKVNLMIIFWKLKRLMLRMEMIGVDENDNEPESEDASHDNVDDFNEDTCEVCL